MLKVKVPGKVMLAGEWSVLEPGNICLVMPTNKFMEATIKGSDKIIFNAPDVGLVGVSCVWDGRCFSVDSIKIDDFGARFKFCFYATQVTLQFLQDQQKKIEGFEISIKSELSKIDDKSCQFLKLGLGSSAATTVLVCKAILAFNGYDINSDSVKEIMFKLAYVAHFLASGKMGSGFDVAASAFQTALIYSRFDPYFLKNVLKSGQSMVETISMPWPKLCINKLQLPANLKIVVGYSGEGSSTPEMIKKMSRLGDKDLSCFKHIFDNINNVVKSLILAFKENKKDEIEFLIRQNRQLLLNLASESGVELETKSIRRMIKETEFCGAVAKISGAGGGDCVIALCFDNNVAHKIKEFWPESFIIFE